MSTLLHYIAFENKKLFFIYREVNITSKKVNTPGSTCIEAGKPASDFSRIWRIGMCLLTNSNDIGIVQYNVASRVRACEEENYDNKKARIAPGLSINAVY